MKILKIGKKNIDVFRQKCDCCKSKLEFTMEDIDEILYPFIECPVCKNTFELSKKNSIQYYVNKKLEKNNE